MRKIEVEEIKPADEFIVEAMMHDGKFKVIGVVLTQNNLLNDDDLNEIWDFANWGVNGKEQCLVANGVHVGQKVMTNGKMSYVIASIEVGVVNDNVLVRKHYDTDHGYYIKSARLHKDLTRDVWCFGSHDTIQNEYKSNHFMCTNV